MIHPKKLFATSAAVVAACALAPLPRAAGAATTEAAATPLATPLPLDPANLDKSVKPGDDFFHFANGTWLKNNPIPADQTRWGSFNMLEERNKAALKEILEACAADAAKGGDAARPGSDRQKVGDFYRSGMDEAAVENDGVKPLQPYFDRIAGLKDRAELPKLLADLHLMGVYVLFQPSVDADEKDSETDIVQFYQGGLGLPDRDYYLLDDERSKDLRTGYEAHVARMLTLLGDPADQAAAEAKAILAFETDLAKNSKTRVDLRDPQGNYHKMPLADLAKAASGFDWKAYFVAVGAPEPGSIDVKQNEFITHAAQVAQSGSLDDWKLYLRWQLLHATAPYLGKVFVDENFNFFGKSLTGAKEDRPRWKKVLNATDEALGEALGHLYVEKNFPPESKARALALVTDLRSVLRDDLSRLDWMGEETRKAALNKLDHFTVKIGYPDKWRDYSALDVKQQPYVLNVLAGNAFETKRRVAKIGQTVDKSEWGMTPPTVNAYYNPTRNEIVFPAGILQPPFFSAKADDAVNYGGIGGVIGHEMTHGFDDQGRQYDDKGNLKNWWTDEDLKRFEERANKIIKQFYGYEVAPGERVNGKLTQGENIADLGGSKIAYVALQKALGRQGPDVKTQKIDGFTPEQRYFLSWAQVWSANTRPEELRRRLKIDPHSPSQFRCNGPLSNMAEFQQAFEVPDGSAMVRPAADKVQIW